MYNPSHFYTFLMNVKMIVPHKNLDTKVCDIPGSKTRGQNQCASTTEWTQYVVYAHNRRLLIMRQILSHKYSGGKSIRWKKEACLTIID